MCFWSQRIHPEATCVDPHFLSEWEMPPSDWTRDPKAEGAGWGARPRDKGVEREAQTQEEGMSNLQFLFDFRVSVAQRLRDVIPSAVDSALCICCPLQALEEEFTRKLQEQEVFFKMSGESECLNPSTQSRVSKFYPIPNLHNSGL